jgi:hypothetical protein
MLEGIDPARLKNARDATDEADSTFHDHMTAGHPVSSAASDKAFSVARIYIVALECELALLREDRRLRNTANKESE